MKRLSRLLIARVGPKGFQVVLGSLHSILCVVLVLVLFGLFFSLVPHVVARLPKQEGQESLHFCLLAGDTGCTLTREGSGRQETEFGGLLLPLPGLECQLSLSGALPFWFLQNELLQGHGHVGSDRRKNTRYGSSLYVGLRFYVSQQKEIRRRIGQSSSSTF